MASVCSQIYRSGSQENVPEQFPGTRLNVLLSYIFGVFFFITQHYASKNIKQLGVFDFDKVKIIPDDYFQDMSRGIAENGDVMLYKDGSVSVSDDGRGMPVDVHPQHKISGVELILTKLHAGGKFSNKNCR